MDDGRVRQDAYLRITKKSDKVEVLLSGDNVWMTRAALADFYQTSLQNSPLISKTFIPMVSAKKGQPVSQAYMFEMSLGEKGSGGILYYVSSMFLLSEPWQISAKTARQKALKEYDKRDAARAIGGDVASRDYRHKVFEEAIFSDTKK